MGEMCGLGLNLGEFQMKKEWSSYFINWVANGGKSTIGF